MNIIKLLGILVLAMTLSFGCDMGTEYEGDNEPLDNEKKGVDLGDWDREKTAEFVRATYSSNRLGIELSQIAKDRARHTEVQEFAQHMIEDHTKVNEQLMDIAAQKEFDLSEGLIEKHRKKLNELQEKVNEDDFDEEYLDRVENLHKDAVDNLEDAADNVTDMELKNWINTTLPKMKNHLERVEELNKQIDSGIF